MQSEIEGNDLSWTNNVTFQLQTFLSFLVVKLVP